MAFDFKSQKSSKSKTAFLQRVPKSYREFKDTMIQFLEEILSDFTINIVQNHNFNESIAIDFQEALKKAIANAQSDNWIEVGINLKLVQTELKFHSDYLDDYDIKAPEKFIKDMYVIRVMYNALNTYCSYLKNFISKH